MSYEYMNDNSMITSFINTITTYTNAQLPGTNEKIITFQKILFNNSEIN